MQLDTIYVVHHTHTDIGYTIDQPIFWEMQYRFIDEALRLIERYQGNPPDSRFRWTVETTCGLEAWLQTASRRDIDRLAAADQAGLIEIMAMQTNNTPLLNSIQLIESFRSVQKLRKEYGLDIRHAMNCDINGQNWPLTDILLDEGIEAFSMAINHHFGGMPEPCPNVFLWQTPSGRKLPTFNGWTYSKAFDFGLAGEDDTGFLEWLPQIEAKLTQTGYPLSFLMIQGFHPFGDNGSAWGGYAEFASRWNASGRTPRIVTATPRMFWNRARKHLSDLQTLRGDWTDYWNFGCISAARETTIARTTRSRLFRSDGVSSILRLAPPAAGNVEDSPARWSQRTQALYRDAAWRALNLYGEHTWGADSTSLDPELEDSRAMDNHKKHMVYEARSLSKLLERDALADLAHFVPRNDQGELLVFNPLAWARWISGPIPKNTLIPRGLCDDPSSGRHNIGRYAPPTDFWTGRAESESNGGMGWLLAPVKVPAFGYTVVDWGALTSMTEAAENENEVVENQRFRIQFDTQRGGIQSLFDKKLEREWVDAASGYGMNTFVHEEVADHEDLHPRKQLNKIDWSVSTNPRRAWNPDWKASRTLPLKVILHKVYEISFGIIAEQILQHESIGKILQRTFLPSEGDRIEFQSEWQMGTSTHPEATYLLYPFNLAEAQARLDIDGVPVRPNLDQIPGCCRDYFTVQNWVDFNNGQYGVVVATPENPMVQLGDFHFAHDQSDIALERAMLLGWVTNNYWETNFPGAQPGVVTARYAILPYQGGFNEAQANRFAAEVEHSRPLVQHTGEPAAEELLPGCGTLLNLPIPPILTLNLRPVSDGEVQVTLFNASDENQTATLSGGLVHFAKAWRCDLHGNRLAALDVEDGALQLEIEPRRILTIIIGNE